MNRILPFVFLVFILNAIQIAAQTLTTLYSVGDLPQQVGVRPAAPLLYAPDGLLYGSTSEAFGAGLVRGALFKMTPDGAVTGIVKQFTNVLEGTSPKGRLVLDGDTLYGLTTRGGLHGGGTVFRVRTNGNDFAVLVSLPSHAFLSEPRAVGGLTLSGSTLYGAVPSAGSSNAGAIFKIETDGTKYTVIKEFLGDDGQQPNGDLLLVGSALFGTTASGGGTNLGTVFRLETDGSDFSVLKTFQPSNYFNDGAYPGGGLLIANGALYGATLGGGEQELGTVFKINQDGSGFERVLSLANDPQAVSTFVGGGIVGTLALSGETLYGVASEPRSLAPGARLFRVNLDGSNYAILGWTRASLVRAGVTLVNGEVFGAAYASDSLALPRSIGHVFRSSSNADVSEVVSEFSGYAGDGGLNSITRSGDYLYGTTAVGGAASAGTLFRIKTNGTDYSVLYSFPGGTNGQTPASRLAISKTNIFGQAYTAPPVQTLTYFIGLDGSEYQVLRRARLSYAPFRWLAGERPSFLPAPIAFNGRVYGEATATDSGLDYGTFSVKPDGSDYRIIGPVVQSEFSSAADAIFGTLGSFSAVRILQIGSDERTNIVTTLPSGYTALPGRMARIGQTLFGLVNLTNMNRLFQTFVFKVNTNGSGFALLGSLTDQIPGDPSNSSLVTDGRHIYGTTEGLAGVTGGTIFQLSADGTNPTVVYQFPADRGNVQLDGELQIEGNVLYGSNFSGGDVGQGAIFRLDLSPRLAISSSPSGATLSWPSYARDYILETKAHLLDTEWRTVQLPEPGKTAMEITNLSERAFYRLRSL